MTQVDGSRVGRAASFLAALFISSGTLSVLEGNSTAHALASLALASAPIFHLSLSYRVVWILLVIAAYPLGPAALPFLALVGFSIRGRSDQAIALFLFLLVVPHWYARLLIVRVPGGIALGSAAFMMMACLGTLVLFATDRAWAKCTKVASFYVIGWFGLVLAARGEWLTTATFTDETFRTLLVAVPAVLPASLSASVVRLHLSGLRAHVLVGVLVGAFLIGWLAPRTSAIDRVVFDEAHGNWETVTATYDPNDFGRNHAYTYKLLLEYAERLSGPAHIYREGELPGKSGDLFVLKMPTESLSSEFEDEIIRWVANGGRLLVVADHTDLFDTTQISNRLLSRLGGLAIASTATFDRDGKPCRVTGAPASALQGRITGARGDFVYQTGASFSRLPLSALVVGTYGPSFEEHAVYFRPNRFGYFHADFSQPFGDHAAIAAISVGNGLVVVVGDSTPWSNFSMYKAAYKDLFRDVLAILARPDVFRWYPYLLTVCCFAFVLLLVAPNRLTIGLATFIGGLLAGGYFSIGSAAFIPADAPRDYDLRVILGKGANVESLAQLVPFGEANYARILSSIQKYGARPRASFPGDEGGGLGGMQNYLLIDPDGPQLPTPDDVISFVRSGGRLTLLFPPERTKDEGLSRWLDQLGLRIGIARALAVSEQPFGGLEERKGLARTRYVTYRVLALPTSLFQEVSVTAVGQSFTVRPVDLTRPPDRGVLSIGFAADQFGDLAVGEIWDGTIPPQLARQREREFAALVLGTVERRTDALEISRHTSAPTMPIPLRDFVVLKNGKTLFQGRIEEGSAVIGSAGLGSNPDVYLGTLQREALAFIKSDCSTPPTDGSCARTLIANDLTEWVVNYQTDQSGVAAIELMHDRRFSGLGANYNIVFTKP